MSLDVSVSLDTPALTIRKTRWMSVFLLFLLSLVSLVGPRVWVFHSGAFAYGRRHIPNLRTSQFRVRSRP